MLKKWTSFTVASLLTLSSVPLMAQDTPEASIDVETAFVSNYVWRGTDLFTSRADQKGEAYGEHTGEWAFQPSITYNTPVDGLFFNIWGSFAMAGRTDQDTDGVLQQGPGGSDILAGISNPDAQTVAYQNAFAGSTDISGQLDQANRAGCEGSATCAPGYYEEANGLERLDEIDLTIGYEAETTVGTMGFGYIAYTGPNDRHPFDSVNEIYFSYALPMLPQLGLTVYTDTSSNGGASKQYFNLAYSDSLEISEGVSFDYSTGIGYGNKQRLQGIQDWTSSVGVSAFGFFASLTYVTRPDLRFHDTDSQNAGDETVPFWLDGRSTIGDGLVADPSQTNGQANTYVNAIVADFLATTSGNSAWNTNYKPRQKIPRSLYYITVGYGFSI